MQKTTVKEDPAFAKPKGNAPATRLTTTLVDGRTVTRQVDDMPGFPGQPMSRADMERKFRGNVGSRWPAAQVDALLQALWSFERTEDLRALMGQFSLPA